ncbi:unnamed protein product [Mytilus coruscus]|uniref:Uncharacterized protein n=1 Tax=Mytilus coruscus TaxID=42192 RepID=A0A6J8EUS7_MYTCO|nr:unnamed protein product [Mytilus coruscus]
MEKVVNAGCRQKYLALGHGKTKISPKYLFKDKENLEPRIKEIDDSTKLGDKMKVKSSWNRDKVLILGKKGPDTPTPEKNFQQEREGGSGPLERNKHSHYSVSTFINLNDLQNTTDIFVAGKISYYSETWKTITSDRNLLNVVCQGYHLEFEPCSKCSRKENKFNDSEQIVIDSLLTIFLDKKVIETVWGSPI